jgi:hypothetical protein
MAIVSADVEGSAQGARAIVDDKHPLLSDLGTRSLPGAGGPLMSR